MRRPNERRGLPAVSGAGSWGGRSGLVAMGRYVCLVEWNGLLRIVAMALYRRFGPWRTSEFSDETGYGERDGRSMLDWSAGLEV